jgi:hypothetical protein
MKLNVIKISITTFGILAHSITKVGITIFSIFKLRNKTLIIKVKYYSKKVTQHCKNCFAEIRVWLILLTVVSLHVVVLTVVAPKIMPGAKFSLRGRGFTAAPGTERK